MDDIILISGQINDKRSRSCTTSSRRRFGSSTRDRKRQFSSQSQSGTIVSTKRLSLISSCHHIPRVFLPSSTTSSSVEVTSPSSLSQSDPDLSSNLSQDEETISLAFIKTSAIVHRYVASRGQRERETEIYELVPTTIDIRRNCISHSQSSSNIFKLNEFSHKRQTSYKKRNKVNLL